MSKITLSIVADLTNSTTAQATINSYSDTVQSAFDNTLSRDGTSPNTMGAALDMNSNQIINLPAPSTVNSPARLIDVTSNPTIVVPGTGTSGHTVPFLDGNNTFSGVNTFGNGQVLGTPTSVTLTNASGLPITTGVSGLAAGVSTFLATPTSSNLAAAVTNETGTGNLVFNTNPSLTLSSITNSGTVAFPNVNSTLLSTGGMTFGNSSGGNPTGTTSLTGVMMGLGSSFPVTPLFSSRIMFIIMGQIANNTAGDGAAWNLRVGTGVAPANGAALTGSVVGTQFLTTATVNTGYPFTIIGIGVGFTPGVAVWFDLSLAALTGGTATISNARGFAYEM